MILLGEMLAELVRARTGLEVDHRSNLGGTLVCYNALRQGGLDAYVEYTGTALTTILKQPPRNDPGQVLRAGPLRTRRDAGVRCLDPLGFENTFAILMRRDQAERLGIRKISDLRDHLETIRPGGGSEFMNRPDGYQGLVRAYGLDFAHEPREMDRNLLYQALAQGSIDLAAGDSTDGRIPTLDLVILEDDRRYFPPYEAVPLARIETLKRHPGLADALNALAGKIDAADDAEAQSRGRRQAPRPGPGGTRVPEVARGVAGRQVDSAGTAGETATRKAVMRPRPSGRPSVRDARPTIGDSLRAGSGRQDVPHRDQWESTGSPAISGSTCFFGWKKSARKRAATRPNPIGTRKSLW